MECRRTDAVIKSRGYSSWVYKHFDLSIELIYFLWAVFLLQRLNLVDLLLIHLSVFDVVCEERAS